MDIFTRILRSRPNTFTTFNATGPVENGFSPLSQSLTPAVERGTIVPGGLTYNARATATTLTYTGRVFSDPEKGGSGSIEMILRSPAPSQTVTTIVDIPQSLNMSIGPDGYILTLKSVSGNSVVTAPRPSVPSVDHVAVNVNGGSASMVINGNSYYVAVPPEMPGGDGVSIGGPADMRIWGVVIRPHQVAEEYCKEITKMLASFPKPSEADQPFAGVSFHYDFDSLSFLSRIELQDIDYSDPALSSVMYNGYDGDTEIPPDKFYSPIPSVVETVDTVAVRSNRVLMTLVSELGDAFVSTPGVTSIGTFDAVAHSSLIGVDLEVSPDNGIPMHGSIGVSEGPMKIIPDSSPDQSSTITSPSNIIGDGRLFHGGLDGNATVDPDADAIDSTDYPEAYGLWVLLSSPKTIVSAPGMSIAYGTGITSSGTSSVYVDGAPYTSGSVSPGWHHIAFIPSAKQNSSISINAGGGTVVHSFSKYYAPSPASYIADIYPSYVDPKVIKHNSNDSLSISDSATRIYSHDWSITAVD